MVSLAAQAAASRTFDEKTLRLSLAEIAKRSFGDGTTVNQALEEGWRQGVPLTMANGIATQSEVSRLREFRGRLALSETDPELPNPTVTRYHPLQSQNLVEQQFLVSGEITL